MGDASSLSIRRRWNTGAFPVPDPEHPLTAGLWFHRTSSLPGRATGTMSWGVSPYGRCAQSADNDDCYAVPIPAMPTPTISAFTFHSIKRMTARDVYAVNGGIPADPQSGSWSTPYWQMAMAADFTADTNYFHTNNAGTLLTLSMGTNIYLTDSEFHSYTGSWGIGGAAIYRDGQQIETSATQPNGSSSWTPAAIVGNPEVIFLCRSASAVGEGFTGQHVLTIVWLRALSPNEVAMVHADPFCMLMR